MADNKSITESRDSVSEATIRQALGLCRDLTNEHGRQLLQVMFEVGSERMLEQASDTKAENAKNFREVSRSLASMAPRIIENYSRIFLALFDDKGGAEAAPKAGFSTGLSLVDEEALEQEILISRMSSRAASETQSQFSKLNRRFCFLLNRRIMPMDNPLSPKSQAFCMTEALEALDIQDNARRVLLNALEQEFANALGYLYSEINETMIDLGILPDIKHHVWRAEVSTRARSRAGLTESQRKALDELHRPDEHELQEMLTKVSSSLSVESGADIKPVAVDDFRRNAARLSQLLQQIDQTGGPVGGSLLERLDAAAESASEKRMDGPAREIVQQADEIATRFSRSFGRRGDTREAFLASKVAAPLARLSVDDPSIIINEQHVLRQAMRDMGGYADYLEVTDAQVREELLEEFEELTEGFELLDFQEPETIAAYAADISSKSALLKLDLKEQLQRLAQHEDGRSRLTLAQRSIDQLLKKALVGNRFPSSALEFLFGKWRSILVHCYLSAEENAPGWQAARSTTDKLVLLIPELEKGIPDARQAELGALTKSLWNQLVKYVGYRGAPNDLLNELGLQSEEAFDELGADERGGLAVLLGENDSTWREVTANDSLFTSMQVAVETVSPAQAEKAYLLWKDRLKPGTWVEILEDDVPRRCRLMKVFGAGERCIFVDGLGRLTQSLNAMEVLEKVKQGKLKKAA